MPIYCYSNDSGHVIEKHFKMGKAPETIKVKGKRYERDFAVERQGFPASKGWPMECVASGVNAEQSKELSDFFKKSGVPTEVSKDGNPIYRDANHRRRALKARNFVDKASFY